MKNNKHNDLEYLDIAIPKLGALGIMNQPLHDRIGHVLCTIATVHISRITSNARTGIFLRKYPLVETPLGLTDQRNDMCSVSIDSLEVDVYSAASCFRVASSARTSAR